MILVRIQLAAVVEDGTPAANMYALFLKLWSQLLVFALLFTILSQQLFSWFSSSSFQPTAV
jgi:hypothetical protein